MKIKVYLFLLLVLMAANLKIYANSTFTVGNNVYTILSEETMTCEFHHAVIVNGHVDIPATVEYNGKTWTVIGVRDSAFENNTGQWGEGIETLSLSEGLTYIGQRAFSGFYNSDYGRQYYHRISKIEIPSTITDIGGFAFHYANGDPIKPTEVILKDSHTLLKGGKNDDWIYEHYSEPFAHLYISKVYIGRNIDSDVFGGGLTLTEEIVIGDQVTELTTLDLYGGINRDISLIEEHRPTRLHSLTIGKGLKQVPDFKEGVLLNKIHLNSNTPQKAEGFRDDTYEQAVLYVPYNTKSLYESADVWKKFKTIVECDENGNEPDVPSNQENEGSKEIEYAYSDDGTASVWGITDKNYSGEIIVPNQVTWNNKTYIVAKIYDNAFSQCKNVKNFKLGKNIVSIGENAFKDCTGITVIDIPENTESIKKAAFKGCTNLQTVNFGYSLKDIEEEAFEGCSSLSSLEFSERLHSIGKYCFANCSNLSRVSSVTSNVSLELEDFSFSQCTKLKELFMLKRDYTLWTSTFEGCEKLEWIYFDGSGIQAIGSPFGNLSCLKDFYVNTMFPPGTVYMDAFNGTDVSKVTLHVATGGKEFFSSRLPWSNFGSILEDAASDISSVESDASIENGGIFDILGRRHIKMKSGVYIFKTKDGRIKKCLIK